MALTYIGAMHATIQSQTFLADCRNAGLSDDDVLRLVVAIASDPLAGDVIAGTGGARKRRFAGRGNKGKSAGYRTVSYYAGDDVPVLMMRLIDKGERANLSHAERNVVREELAGYAKDYRAGLGKRVRKMKDVTP
jgi:hypothetical protein